MSRLNRIGVVCLFLFLGCVGDGALATDKGRHVYWDGNSSFKIPRVLSNVTFDYTSRQFAPHVDYEWVCPDNFTEKLVTLWLESVKREFKPDHYNVIDMEYWRPVWSRLWGNMKIYQKICKEELWNFAAVDVLSAPLVFLENFRGVGYYDIVSHGLKNPPSPEDFYIKMIMGGVNIFHSIYVTSNEEVFSCPESLRVAIDFHGDVVIPVASPYFRHAPANTSPILIPDPTSYAKRLRECVGEGQRDIVLWTASDDPKDEAFREWVMNFAEAW